MLPTRQGSFRLFRLFGIEVFLHWSWFLVAFFVVGKMGAEHPVLWSALAYLALFCLVLVHEYGHALACRQVGGRAEQIVLWPLGGVAYVPPPPRPGPILWSIAAGPLVNVVLWPLLEVLYRFAATAEWYNSMPDLFWLLWWIRRINLGLLVFNLLPIYPLDGGQILRSLLWFFMGPSRSLMVATITGFVGAILLIAAAVLGRSIWLVILAGFMLAHCWSGLMRARVLAKIAKLPRRAGFACPECKNPPLLGSYWRCSKCSQGFDTFETGATCPNCGERFAETRCFDCGGMHHISEWEVASQQVPPRL
jgi:Zn-dependent protease